MKDEITGHGDKQNVLSPRRPFILPPSSFILSNLEAMKGVEPLSFGLQDRRSVIQLSYIAESLVELRGVEPLRPACKAGIIP